jgi:hypothetical protein
MFKRRRKPVVSVKHPYVITYGGGGHWLIETPEGDRIWSQTLQQAVDYAKQMSRGTHFVPMTECMSY